MNTYTLYVTATKHGTIDIEAEDKFDAIEKFNASYPELNDTVRWSKDNFSITDIYNTEEL